MTSEDHNNEENSDNGEGGVKDLDQAAWDFRQRYYGPDNNPVPLPSPERSTKTCPAPTP